MKLVKKFMVAKTNYGEHIDFKHGTLYDTKEEASLNIKYGDLIIEVWEPE